MRSINKWMFYPFLISGDADDHAQPTSSLHVDNNARTFYYMKLKSGGSIPEGTLPVVKKAKASFRVALWNFSAYPKLILKNYQTLCLKRLDFQTVAWGQGQSLLTSTAVRVMSTITKLKSSLFCKLGEDMNCCFTSEGGVRTRSPQYSPTLHSSKNKEASGASPSLCSTPTAGPWWHGRKWAELHNSESKQVVFTSNKVSWYETSL